MKILTYDTLCDGIIINDSIIVRATGLQNGRVKLRIDAPEDTDLRAMTILDNKVPHNIS